MVVQNIFSMKRKIIFLGCTKFSKSILEALLNSEHEIVAIFSIPEKFPISYSSTLVNNSNFFDLYPISKKNNIPYNIVESRPGKRLIDHLSLIQELQPDIILAAGWYYMIPGLVRSIPKEGVWGLHSSLLPNYAGGAPLVWAIINGEKKTGVTLFRMEEGVDNGDIIGQTEFPILEEDTIREVLDKSVKSSIEVLLENLSKEKIDYHKQDTSQIKIFPQRSPEDGEIDWTKDSESIQNFIRAQTNPYPGAWTMINGKKVIIWSASVCDIENTKETITHQ